MNFKGKTVLICDDSILARRKFKDFLKSLEIADVYEAADGEEAVAKYKESKPDVVFMDIVMPKKDGVQAVQEIVAFDSEAKVIMASSVGTQNYLNNAIKAGACDFLQKPLDEDAVVQSLIKALGGN